MGNQNQKPGTPGKPEPVPYTTFSLAKKPAENPNEPQKEDENDRIVEVISSESLKDDSQDKNSLDPRVFQNYQTFFEKFCKFADLQPLISNPALFETDFSVNKDKTALEFFWGEAQKRKTSLDVLDGITPRLFFDIFAEYQTEFMKIHHGLHSEELTLLRKLGEAKLTSNTLNQKIAEKADKLKKVAICLEDGTSC